MFFCPTGNVEVINFLIVLEYLNRIKRTSKSADKSNLKAFNAMVVRNIGVGRGVTLL